MLSPAAMVLSGREVNQVQSERQTQEGVLLLLYLPQASCTFPVEVKIPHSTFSGEELGPSPPERDRLKQKLSGSQFCPKLRVSGEVGL